MHYNFISAEHENISEMVSNCHVVPHLFRGHDSKLIDPSILGFNGGATQLNCETCL